MCRLQSNTGWKPALDQDSVCGALLWPFLSLPLSKHLSCPRVRQGECEERSACLLRGFSSLFKATGNFQNWGVRGVREEHIARCWESHPTLYLQGSCSDCWMLFHRGVPLSCGAFAFLCIEIGTQDLELAKHTRYHWGTPSALSCPQGRFKAICCPLGNSWLEEGMVLSQAAPAHSHLGKRKCQKEGLGTELGG